MFNPLNQHCFNSTKRLLSSFILVFFATNTIMPPQIARAQFQGGALPAVGSMVTKSSSFEPSIIKGITIHPENPLAFEFIVDTGDNHLQGDVLQAEANKMIKYFLASLTVPEKDLWVNLSPYEKGRIVAPEFGQTEMGRDLLAQDYILKQLTASLIYPESDLGKEFWGKVRAKVQAQFGTTDLPVNTFNKVWIVPNKAVVYEHNNSAFVVESHLKVMLEEDYLSLQKNSNLSAASVAGVDKTKTSSIGSQVIRDVLIPQIEEEINTGKNFANLRQIYNSMILAVWYKKTLRDSLLGQVYMDQNKVKGVDLADTQAKEKIYQQYLQSFKKGAYNYIKEEIDPATKQVTPRKYFSGGAVALPASALQRVTDATQLTTQQRATLPSDSTVNVSAVLGENPLKGADEAMSSYHAGHQERYTIRNGDTWQTLATRFSVSAAHLREINRGNPAVNLNNTQALPVGKQINIERKDKAMVAFRADAKLPGGNVAAAYSDVLSPKALEVLDAVAPLTDKLTELRTIRETGYRERQTKGIKLGFLAETNSDGSDALIADTNITVKDARAGRFEGAPVPKDLQIQTIQLTGPAAKSPQDKIGLDVEKSTDADLRNAAHALLSGANGMMFDGEDALGQLDTMSLDNVRALMLAYNKSERFMKIAAQVAEEYIKAGKRDANWDWRALIENNFTTRIYRVRGLHLDDRHTVFTNAAGQQQAVSATIADMVTYLVNAGPTLLSQGSTPTLYLPKLQTAQEAAFMARIIDAIEDQMGWDRGTVKVFVLIEQLSEAFQLIEMRAALGKHFVGYNTGRWDYIASVIKENMWDSSFVPPNFTEMTMMFPFMKAYEDRVIRVVNTPDINGNKALWIGGMEPQIPVVKGTISETDKNKAIENAMQIAEVSKLREALGATQDQLPTIKQIHQLISALPADVSNLDATQLEQVTAAFKQLGTTTVKAQGTWVAHPGMVDRLRKLLEKLHGTVNRINELGLLPELQNEKFAPLDYSPEAAAKLTELRSGPRTVAEARFLISVAMQYVNAYLTGRAAAALKGADFFSDPLKLFIMEDMATGEGRTQLAFKWMKSNADITTVSDEDARLFGISAGAKFTPELMKAIIEQEYTKLQTAPDNIVFGSSKKVELPIAKAIIDAFFADQEGLPWLIDLANQALGEKDLDKAKAKLETYIAQYKSSGGLTRITGNPDFVRADAAMTTNVLPTERVKALKGTGYFKRTAQNWPWTDAELAALINEQTPQGATELQNLLSQKLRDGWAAVHGKDDFLISGGVMDGPSAAAAAEAGAKFIYLSGWQASHHWGQPDLAKYPLDTVPNVIKNIYKYLENKSDQQQIQLNKITRKLDAVFEKFFADLKDAQEADVQALKDAMVKEMVKAAKIDTDIYVNAIRSDADQYFTSLFASLLDEVINNKQNYFGASTSQAKRDETREAARFLLKKSMVDYRIPVFADGDAGHQSVGELVRLFINANAAAIHLEDQLHGEKKCGHMSGKVLVSIREHYKRLLEAQSTALRMGSLLSIIARTDAQAAKLLASNEDARDHFAIKGTTKKIPSLAYIIRLSRREVDEYDGRANNADIIEQMKKAMPGVNEAELKEILSSKTPEDLVNELRGEFPILANLIEQIWKLRGQVKGERLEANEQLYLEGGQGMGLYVEDVWKNAEAIRFGEYGIKLNEVLEYKGQKMTVEEILNRKPQGLEAELKVMEELTNQWDKLADLKTYRQAVADEIKATKTEAVAALWMKATDPLQNTLSLDQMKALAKTYGVAIDWSWEPARTYEGFYQIDSKIGAITAAVRSRVFARIATSVWMEQEKPNLKEGAKYIADVNADPKAAGVYHSMNISPSFNWSNPESWSHVLSKDEIAKIKELQATKGFDIRDSKTWGIIDADHQAAIAKMMDAINSFSSDMGKVGNDLQFVTIFQDHTSSRAMAQSFQMLLRDGAGGFVRNVQQQEQAAKDRFVTHQKAAGVPRVEAGEEITARGSSATGAGGKASTETGFTAAAKKETTGGEDHALTAEPVGGINLDPTLMNLQIKRDGKGIPLPVSQQPMSSMKIDGFMPIIIKITPVDNLPILLGFNPTTKKTLDYGSIKPNSIAKEPEQLALLK